MGKPHPSLTHNCFPEMGMLPLSRCWSIRTGSDSTQPSDRAGGEYSVCKCSDLFPRVSGWFGADRRCGNFLSWRLHLQQIGQATPNSTKTRQLHPEEPLNSPGRLSQQLLAKLHHLKAMKPERKEWRESRKPLSIAFISTSPFLPVAIVLSVPSN